MALRNNEPNRGSKTSRLIESDVAAIATRVCTAMIRGKTCTK